jgi:hypothetical protein
MCEQSFSMKRRTEIPQADEQTCTGAIDEG